MSDAAPDQRRDFILYRIRLRDGEEVELRLFPDHRWACPICGAILGGEPPYNYGEFDEWGQVDPSRPCGEWATASFNICPCCHTHYGCNDDYCPGLSQVQIWAKLRARWLVEEGWSREALNQLCRNLGISEQQARAEAAALWSLWSP